MWIMATAGIGRVCIYSSLSENRISYSLAPPDLCLFLFCSDTYTHFHSLHYTPSFCRTPSGSSTAVSLHGWCNHEISNRNHSFSVQVRVGHRCAAMTVTEEFFSTTSFCMFCFTLVLTFALGFTVFFPVPIEFYQKMDHRY